MLLAGCDYIIRKMNASPDTKPLAALEVLRRHPSPEGTLQGLLASRAVVLGERECLVTPERTLSWRGLEAEAVRACAALRASGIQRGDRIVAMSEIGRAHV
mgnify:FL=1